MWFEKAERSHGGPNSDKFAFWLQSVHPDKRLHSQLCESKELRETYSIQGREPLFMNPQDAEKLGINMVIFYAYLMTVDKRIVGDAHL